MGTSPVVTGQKYGAFQVRSSGHMFNTPIVLEKLRVLYESLVNATPVGRN